MLLANGHESSRIGFPQIVKVSVTNGKLTRKTLAFLYSGSNISYIDEKVESVLKLQGLKSSLKVLRDQGSGETLFSSRYYSWFKLVQLRDLSAKSSPA